MVSGAAQFGGLLPKFAIKKPGRGLEPQGNGSCFPRAPIHQGRKWTAFFSPGHAVTEPRLDRERFSKRDPLMALGQCGWELSSGPVPHVSASYVSMGMKKDANSHAITVILDRLPLNFRMVPANLLLVSPPIKDLILYWYITPRLAANGAPRSTSRANSNSLALPLLATCMNPRS